MEPTRYRLLAVLLLVSSESYCTFERANQLESMGQDGQGFGYTKHGHSVDYCKSPLTTSEECKMNCSEDAHCTGFSYYLPDHAEANSCALYMGNRWRITLGGRQACPSGFPTVFASRGSIRVGGARFSKGGAALETYQKTVPTCVFATTTTSTSTTFNISNTTANPRDPRCRCLHYDRHTQGKDILKTRVEACQNDSVCDWEEKVGSMVTEWTGCCYAKDGGMSKVGKLGDAFCSGSGCCQPVPEEVHCSEEWLDSIKATVSPASTTTSTSCLGIVMLALHSFS